MSFFEKVLGLFGLGSRDSAPRGEDDSGDHRAGRKYSQEFLGRPGFLTRSMAVPLSSDRDRALFLGVYEKSEFDDLVDFIKFVTNISSLTQAWYPNQNLDLAFELYYPADNEPLGWIDQAKEFRGSLREFVKQLRASVNPSYVPSDLQGTLRWMGDRDEFSLWGETEDAFFEAYIADVYEDEISEPAQETTAEEEKELSEWYETKTEMMVNALGQEHDTVMHALIPYAIGGALDLYYFPNCISGTCIATKELSEFPSGGSSNREFDTFEFIMFTSHPLSLDDANDEQTQFGRAHSSMSAVLNLIARYSEQASLNPNETCEFPADMESVGGKCLIFDSYATEQYGDSRFGLLLIIEIFRSEMEYAQKAGGAKLLAKLKEAGHYPYSDLEREPIA